jgi:hypothetical protein
MASQVLSGSGNVSYTNTTGQNVRVIINFMEGRDVGTGVLQISMSWGGTGASTSGSSVLAIGRNLAFNAGYQSGSGFSANTNPVTMTANNMCIRGGGEFAEAALPTEIMLANGQTFSANCGSHNIVVIPENG